MVLKTTEALICSWMGTFAGMVEEVAQEGISAGMTEVGMAQGTLAVDRTLGTLQEDKARGTLAEDRALGTSGVGTQEEAGKPACTAALGRT